MGGNYSPAESNGKPMQTQLAAAITSFRVFTHLFIMIISLLNQVVQTI
jgi:hypothetical protein